MPFSKTRTPLLRTCVYPEALPSAALCAAMTVPALMFSVVLKTLLPERRIVPAPFLSRENEPTILAGMSNSTSPKPLMRGLICQRLSGPISVSWPEILEPKGLSPGFTESASPPKRDKTPAPVWTSPPSFSVSRLMASLNPFKFSSPFRFTVTESKIWFCWFNSATAGGEPNPPRPMIRFCGMAVMPGPSLLKRSVPSST